MPYRACRVMWLDREQCRQYDAISDTHATYRTLLIRSNIPKEDLRPWGR